MRTLLRRPLTWMVIGECFVVAALTLVAWHVVAAASQSSGASTAAPPSVTTPHLAGGAPIPTLPVVTRHRAPTQLPGLNLDSVFWRVRLGQLNRDQAFFEQLEWRIIHSAMDAMNRYLETVVLPSITRAERGAGTKPA